MQSKCRTHQYPSYQHKHLLQISVALQGNNDHVYKHAPTACAWSSLVYNFRIQFIEYRSIEHCAHCPPFWSDMVYSEVSELSMSAPYSSLLYDACFSSLS